MIEDVWQTSLVGRCLVGLARSRVLSLFISKIEVLDRLIASTFFFSFTFKSGVVPIPSFFVKLVVRNVSG